MNKGTVSSLVSEWVAAVRGGDCGKWKIRHSTALLLCRKVGSVLPQLLIFAREVG